MLSDGMVVLDKSQSVQIVLRGNVPVVQGKTVDENGQVVPNALVALLPEPPRDTARLELFRKAVRSDQNGFFEFNDGVIPGKYRTYAFGAEENSDIYLDTEFVASIRDKGTPLLLQEGQQASSGNLVVIHGSETRR